MGPQNIIYASSDNVWEARPKCILRAPPERSSIDPVPIREGIAHLKDAGAVGIPPNAGWTKMYRTLVDPEALEQANERFEEWPEFVIVPRVLTREEIETYAARSIEVRRRRKEIEERLGVSPSAGALTAPAVHVEILTKKDLSE